MPADTHAPAPSLPWRLLRALSTRAFHQRGGRRITEGLRRRFAQAPRRFWLQDVDGDIAVQVRLDEHIGSHIFWQGSYSPWQLREVDRLLRPGELFIDAGANIGEFTLFAAKRVGPTGHVLAFEPDPDIHRALAEHVARNGFTQVHLFAEALSDHLGEATLHVPQPKFSDGTEHSGLRSLFPGRGSEPRATVPLTTIDTVLEREGLQDAPVCLMKVDIEGAELEALRGAERTLRIQRPRLIVEVTALTSDMAGQPPDAVLRYLEGLGYDFESIERSGLKRVTRQTLGRAQNLLCTPH